MPAANWTLNRLIDKVRDDLDLHAEDFVTSDDLEQYIEDAITDAEEIVVDCHADTLLSYEDLTVTEGQQIINLPTDIYESRIRGIYYSETGFGAASTFSPYKLRRIKIEDVGDHEVGDYYRYLLVNTTTYGQKLYLYPPAAEASTGRFRVWYIRQFKRPTNMTDVLDAALRPQYILSHVKCSVYTKEGDPMLEVEAGKLLKQEEKMKKSLSRLTDDDEGVLLEPDEYSLSEAYGEDY